MLRSLRTKVGDAAEDVFHEALVNMIENILEGKFSGKSTIGTYLYAIANKLCLKRYDRKGRDDRYMKHESVRLHLADDPETMFINDEKRSLIDKTLSQLKPRNREVLRLWMRKFSMQEIADRLGYESATVVRITKSRSLKKLAEIIDGDPRLKRMLEEIAAKD